MSEHLERIENPTKPGCVPTLLAGGGSVEGALVKYHSRGGYCTEAALPSERRHQVGDAKVAGDYLDNLIRRFVDERAGEFDAKGSCGVRTSQLDAPGARGSALWCSMNRIAAQAVEARIDALCGERTPFPPLDYTTLNVDSVGIDALIDGLNAALNDEIPVGFGYNACFLIEKNCDSAAAFNHASSIVGRRPGAESGTCEYKIRNSWGANCDPYIEPYKRTCAEDPGHIWVSEADLRRVMSEVTYINK